MAFVCAVVPILTFDDAPELGGSPSGYHVGRTLRLCLDFGQVSFDLRV